MREEQNNLIIFSSEREYFRDVGLKNNDYSNMHKENGWLFGQTCDNCDDQTACFCALPCVMMIFVLTKVMILGSSDFLYILM